VAWDGGRGFLRAHLTVYGRADHSAAQRPTVSAISRATRLVNQVEKSAPTDSAEEFGLPPKITVTSIRGGAPGAWSVVPDRCEIEADVRLTPNYTADQAWQTLRTAVADLDTADPAPRPSEIKQTTESWPPFRLPDGHPLVTALAAGAHAAGLNPAPAVAGPSNIGCLLASRGIPATAGFGVAYRGLHAANEAADLTTLTPVQVAYHHALLTLLQQR
jgi:succinyl-diaminopimelate desuccinylase